MAEAKAILLSIVFSILAITIGIQIWSYAVTKGGYTDNGELGNLATEVQTYQDRTQALTNTMANSTKASATTAPTDSESNLAFALLTRGAQTITLIFDSLALFFQVIGQTQFILNWIGIPAVPIAYLYIFIGLTVTMAILSAVLKWWF